MGRPPDKYRVQLDFTPEGFRELENLKTAVQASNRADTIRYAMRVLRWLLDELRSGARIAVYRNNAFSEVKFPFLPHFEAEPTAARDVIREEDEQSREYLRARGRRRQEQAARDRGQEVNSVYEAARQAGRDAIREALRHADEAAKREERRRGEERKGEEIG
jgi:hypothetical protein